MVKSRLKRPHTLLIALETVPILIALELPHTLPQTPHPTPQTTGPGAAAAAGTVTSGPNNTDTTTTTVNTTPTNTHATTTTNYRSWGSNSCWDSCPRPCETLRR